VIVVMVLLMSTVVRLGVSYVYSETDYSVVWYGYSVVVVHGIYQCHRPRVCPISLCVYMVVMCIYYDIHVYVL